MITKQKITVTKLTCERCGYSWIPKIPIEQVVRCSKCKTPYWNKPKKTKQIL